MQLADLLYSALFWILLLAVAALAWRLGGGPEKRAAALYLAAAIASQFAIDAVMYAHVELGLTIIDTLVLTGLLWLALTTGRLWAILSAALQALSCLAHFEKLIEPRNYRLGYQLMAEASSYPIVILLAIGVWRTRVRALRRTG